MRKKSLVLGVFVFSVLLAVTFVMAQTSASSVLESVTEFLNDLAKGLGPLFNLFLGDTGNGEVLFAKILLFIIVLTIVWATLDRVEIFGTNLFLLWIISIAVSILAIRFIGNTIINTILLPYTVLGIVISAALPFILVFFLIEVVFSKSGKTIRRVAWIFYIVVFGGLMITRQEGIGDLGVGYLVWIYPITLLLAILSYLFDGTIQSTFNKMKLERMSEPVRQKKEELLIERKERIMGLDTISDREKDKRIKQIDKQLERLVKRS